MSFILGVKTSFPENHYTQNQFYDFLSTIWPKHKNLVQKFHSNVQVVERAICLPLQEIVKLNSFAERNKIWKEKALELSTQSIEKILNEYHLKASDIDYLVTTSVTGFSIPSLDALLMNKMEFSSHCKRLPLFGFGCLGGVASLNRASDYLKLNPTKLALVVAVELCSLTFQMQDQSLPNMVGTALFADGSAAVLMAGSEHPLSKEAKFEILNYESFFYPNTQGTMGWNIVDTGFQLVLSGDVAELVEKEISHNAKFLFEKNKIKQEDIQYVVSHPGGPKVLTALALALKLADNDLKHSWDSLKEHGNMSSVSVLNVLEKNITDCQGRSQELGLMLAMGPAFNCEISLIKKI